MSNINLSLLNRLLKTTLRKKLVSINEMIPRISTAKDGKMFDGYFGPVIKHIYIQTSVNISEVPKPPLYSVIQIRFHKRFKANKLSKFHRTILPFRPLPLIVSIKRNYRLQYLVCFTEDFSVFHDE